MKKGGENYILEQDWKNFCAFTNKTENFMENEVFGYFDHLREKIKPGSLLSYRGRLCKTYNLHMFRDFNIDFPNVKDYVTKLGTVEEI